MKRSFAKFTDRLDAIGLREKIEKRALTFHVSLEELYDGPRSPSITAARRAVYSWLAKDKGFNEVARLFDRTPGGVWKLARGKS